MEVSLINSNCKTNHLSSIGSASSDLILADCFLKQSLSSVDSASSELNLADRLLKQGLLQEHGIKFHLS